ncbi:MAG: 2-C-methyl-D-erythritol 4-phosphate cytidylyltransferase [Proteobacteria bacterium]|nr:2-C-methyl-D-erythritol 4-phosphate cytidylyltransferase [Pseudomonadota bacterium]
MSSIWAVVPAAGLGRRMAAEVPKQYLQIAGVTLLEHTLRALLDCAQLRGLVVALDPGDRRPDGIALLSDPRVMTALGGANRAESVRSGLALLETMAEPDDWVLVHDAARPCLPLEVLMAFIDTITSTAVGGLLAQPSTDTLKQVDGDGMVASTLDRSTIWRAQTPQMFRLRILCSAFDQARNAGLRVTDEASAVEAAGHPVQIIEGPASNIKVTVPDDLELVKVHLRRMRQDKR